jgi:hypothetical protein
LGRDDVGGQLRVLDGLYGRHALQQADGHSGGERVTRAGTALFGRRPGHGAVAGLVTGEKQHAVAVERDGDDVGAGRLRQGSSMLDEEVGSR